MLIFGPYSRPHAQAAQTPEGRYYPETKHTLAPQFVRFFDTHGGLPLFGYPITEAAIENGYLVQWTERERLEWHPDRSGTPFEVMLGLLGQELTKGMQGASFQHIASAQQTSAQDIGSTGTAVYFPETGQALSEPFLSYWQAHGGLAVFGYPISRVISNGDLRITNGGAGAGGSSPAREVQWFERARFEWHPELPDPFKVSLGLVGTEALQKTGLDSYEVQVSGNSAPDTALHVDLAQGGESDDPAFLENVAEAGKSLGPGMVRLDNVFNFYSIVSRDGSGQLRFAWDRFDRALDAVRAMGKEPLICLSYMPELLSKSGGSRVEPPASLDEWAALIGATVRHVNIERGLGVRYWEVWNEPNQWDFWRGSFPDYLRLYDVTAQAALAADPSVKIGGPAFSTFEPMGITEFVQHEAGLGAQGRVDFLSWHAYGKTPGDISAEVRQARAILDKYPGLNPELFITEFNVLQGGEGDTSARRATDTVEGAIALLSSLEAMQRERLDRAFLFELKDRPGPTRFWGRWGIVASDGTPKPVYHALRSFVTRPQGSLPVSITRGPTDGTLGVMAYGSAARSRVMLWLKGENAARIKITLPTSFDGSEYNLTLFDAEHNNPARSGDGTLHTWMTRDAGDLVFELKPNSLVLLDTATP